MPTPDARKGITTERRDGEGKGKAEVEIRTHVPTAEQYVRWDPQYRRWAVLEGLGTGGVPNMNTDAGAATGTGAGVVVILTQWAVLDETGKITYVADPHPPERSALLGAEGGVEKGGMEKV